MILGKRMLLQIEIRMNIFNYSYLPALTGKNKKIMYT